MELTEAQRKEAQRKEAQRKKVWLVSDTILYTEAVAFMHELIEQEEEKPLPRSQIMGLLNIIRSATYGDVTLYIKHQIERHVHRAFYNKLEKKLAAMQGRRMQEEFQLFIPQSTKREEDAEKKELMLLLAREFIQHLIAENGMYALTDEERSK
jgi:hypothetical protein